MEWRFKPGSKQTETGVQSMLHSGIQFRCYPALNRRLFLFLLRRFVQNFIDYSVLHCAFRVQVEIAVGIVGDFLHILSGIFNDYILDDILLTGNFPCRNLDIGSLTLSTPDGLVHMDCGMR